MAKGDGYGYRRGTRRIVRVPLEADTADIAINDAITAGGTAGFFKDADAAAEPVFGFATESVLSPAADGGAHVLVDVSEDSVYEFPADAGTVSTTLIGKTADIGADGRTVDINGSTTDDLYVVDVNAGRNTVYVQLNRKAKAGGVS